MKAVVYSQSLPLEHPEVLLDRNVPEPEPGPCDCLVEVKAVAVNPVDLKIRMSRQPAEGEFGILGWDASGVVVAVGEQVAGFEKGDEVWYAGSVNRPGCHAELQCVDYRICAHKPNSLDFAQAAAMPLTGLTAWELLFDRMQLHADPAESCRLLIMGGAGGVGSMALQLARSLTTAQIITTASRPESLKWVETMGAEFTIDHHQPLKTQLSEFGISEVTHVASLIATDHHFEELVELLTPQGRLSLIDTPQQSLNLLAMKQKSLSLHWEFMFTRSLFGTQDQSRQGMILSRLAEMVDRGKLKSTMNQHFGKITAENMIRAQRQIETGTTIGKIVLEGF